MFSLSVWKAYRRFDEKCNELGISYNKINPRGIRRRRLYLNWPNKDGVKVTTEQSNNEGKIVVTVLEEIAKECKVYSIFHGISFDISGTKAIYAGFQRKTEQAPEKSVLKLIYDVGIKYT